MAELGSITVDLTLRIPGKDSPRPTWDTTFMDMALIISARGTCPRRRVGAVIVDADNYVLATGYNGSPRGLPHCTEDGCEDDEFGRCTRAVHAEMNALLQAARVGTMLLGGTIYTTDRPCLNCAKAIIQAGLRRVIYLRDDVQSAQRAAALRALKRAAVLVDVVPSSYVRPNIDVV